MTNNRSQAHAVTAIDHGESACVYHALVESIVMTHEKVVCCDGIVVEREMAETHRQLLHHESITPPREITLTIRKINLGQKPEECILYRNASSKRQRSKLSVLVDYRYFFCIEKKRKSDQLRL